MSNSIIHILDETTANKIAAGEVVERPASVVKELVENSIDAKASFIEIEIKNGGIDYIRITDNGHGMSSEDAQRCILRHATSKIRSAEELYAINTLGFRGEALPSISAVSKFTLTTRQKNDELASFVELQGGIVKDVCDAGAAPGTTITVSELFFNTPARRKFLKTSNTESSHINDIIGRLALSHADISFKLINNKKHVLVSLGNGKLVDAIASIYGYKVAQELLPIDWSDELIKVSGFVSKPTILKNSRQWQTVFINCRVVNNRMISKAIDNAYHATLPKSGFPLAVINVEIPKDTIDVNVHPQKNEVKFSDEQTVYRAVYKAILGALTAEPVKVFPAEAARQGYEIAAGPTNKLFENAKQYVSSLPESRSYVIKEQPVLWKKKTLDFTTTRAKLAIEKPLNYAVEQRETFQQQSNDAIAEAEIAPLLPLGQVESCYIVAQGFDGLYIIDQHAAHERIIFNKLSKNNRQIAMQQLLVPGVFDADNIESLMLAEHEQIINELGFSFEQIGPSSFRIIEMPTDLPGEKAEDYFRQLLNLLYNNSGQAKKQDLRQAYLQTAACRTAIKAGDALNMRQIKSLIEELWATELPYTCPHGRPVIVKFSRDELAKLFKRT